MLFPSRTANFERSVISKMVIVTDLLLRKKYKPQELFYEVKNSCDLDEFIDALDCLYMIGKIDFDREKELIYIVESSDN